MIYFILLCIPGGLLLCASLHSKVNPPTGKIKSVCCSCDGTFLLATSGRVLAFGSNEHNNLALNLPPGLKKRNAKVS